MNGQINDQKDQTAIAEPQHRHVLSSRADRESTEGPHGKRHAILSAFATVMSVTAVLYSLQDHAAPSVSPVLHAI